MPPAKAPVGLDTWLVWLLDDRIWYSVPFVRPTLLAQLYCPARPNVCHSSHSWLETEGTSN